MSESKSPQGGSNQTVAYGICVVVGLVVGIIGTMAIKGGGGFGGGGDPVVAEFGGKSVKASEAFGSIKTRLFDLEEEVYRTKEQAINEYVDQKILENEAKKQNLTMEQLLDKESQGATAEVTDKEIEEFLTSKGLSLKDPRVKKDDVREYLKYRQKFEKRQAYVAKLRESSKTKILLAEPESPSIKVSTDGYPTWGNKSAPVTVVEFSDFQCPFCARAVPTIQRLKKEYGPDKIKIVFHHMPLPNHNRAFPASLAAQCAEDQGKFWEMHDMLFENQQKLEDADLKSYSQKLGLDATKFNECFDKKKHEELVNKSRKEAEGVGIQATPSFVINGTLLQGAQPFEKFKEKIDRLAKK